MFCGEVVRNEFGSPTAGREQCDRGLFVCCGNSNNSTVCDIFEPNKIRYIGGISLHILQYML